MLPEDFQQIDPLLTDRTRLAIMTLLAAAGAALDFKTLKNKLTLTAGNLSVHADKLEKAGFVTIEKKFAGKIPVTSYTCTDQGRGALLNYLHAVEKMLKSTVHEIKS